MMPALEIKKNTRSHGKHTKNLYYAIIMMLALEIKKNNKIPWKAY